MIEQTMLSTRRLALVGLLLLLLSTRTASAQPDTVHVSLQSVLERALDVSPDLGESSSRRSATWATRSACCQSPSPAFPPT